jgi:hypothetical protein
MLWRPNNIKQVNIPILLAFCASYEGLHIFPVMATKNQNTLTKIHQVFTFTKFYRKKTTLSNMRFEKALCFQIAPDTAHKSSPLLSKPVAP